MSERYTYSIDEDNSVKIFDANSTDPSIAIRYQPFDPSNMVPFESKEDAEKYAKNTIAEIIFAGNNPRPVVVEEPITE